MLVPLLPARIEQWDNLPGVRIDAAEIGSFVNVAVEAGKGQIAQLVRTVVLACYDMLDVESGEWSSRL